jgi:hypothetical protein
VFQSTLDDFLCNGWASSSSARPEDAAQANPTTAAHERPPAGPAGDEEEVWPPLEPALFGGVHVLTLPFPPAPPASADGTFAAPAASSEGGARGQVLGANIEAALSSPLTELAWSATPPEGSAGGGPEVERGATASRETEWGAGALRESVALLTPSVFGGGSASSAARLSRTAGTSPEAGAASGASHEGAARRRGKTERAGSAGESAARTPVSAARPPASTAIPSGLERAGHLDTLPGFVTSLSVESVPLAATPRGMRAATAEDRVREVDAAEVDEALRRRVPTEQPSLPPSLRSERPAPPSPVEGDEVSRKEATLDEPHDVAQGEVPVEPHLAMPLPVSTLREDSPLQQAVARFTEEARQSSDLREAREARQADVEQSVDAMTLSKRMVADALLEGGERVRIEAVPEDRSVALDVRIDNRDAADFLTLVRGDLMTQLEGSPVARVSVGFQSFDAAGGHDRQGRGGQPSAGRQEEGSASPAPHHQRAVPSGNGRVRVVL